MNKALIYEEDASISSLLQDLCKQYFPSITTCVSIFELANVEHYLDHEANILLLMNASNPAVLEKIDSLYTNYKITVVFLLDIHDLPTLIQVLRNRGERFLFKPISEASFQRIIGDCIANFNLSQDLNNDIVKLTNQTNIYKEVIENHFVEDIISNVPIHALNQYLNTLSFTFYYGMFILVPHAIRDIEFKAFKDKMEMTSMYILYRKRMDFDVCLLISTSEHEPTSFVDDLPLSTYRGGIKYCLQELSLSYEEALASYQESIYGDQLNAYHVFIKFDTINTIMAHFFFRNYLLEHHEDNFSILNILSFIIYKSPFLRRSEMIEHFLHALYKNFSDPYQQTLVHPHLDGSLKKWQSQNDIYQLLYQLCKEMFDSLNIRKDSISYQNLRSILMFINAHCLDKDCNLQVISDTLFISKYHICALFKQYTAFTCTTYINTCKIEHALTLMNTDKSMFTIAMECNFNSLDYFNRIFKKMLGTTPSQYRTYFY